MSDNNTSNGVGFFGLLFIVFLVLKLTGVIAWSWWWVIAPLWLPIIAFLVSTIVITAVFFIVKSFQELE